MTRKIKKVSACLSEKYLKKETAKSTVKYSHLILMILGVLSATFGLKALLLPNSFIDGGITGVSLILTEVTNFLLSVFGGFFYYLALVYLSEEERF